MVTALRRYALPVSLVLFQGALFTAPPDAQNRVSPTPGPIAAEGGSEKEPPREWIDPDTGHRVVRLSDEPGSQSLYFQQNAYTPDGTRLIITTPTGLATIN